MLAMYGKEIHRTIKERYRLRQGKHESRYAWVLIEGWCPLLVAIPPMSLIWRNHFDAMKVTSLS